MDQPPGSDGFGGVAAADEAAGYASPGDHTVGDHTVGDTSNGATSNGATAHGATAHGATANGDTSNGDTSNGIRSVDRAVSTLEFLARHGSAGPSEVAAGLGVHKTTAFRLLAALEGRGLVEPTRERGKYQLGLGILRLASMVPGQLDVVGQGRPVCVELAAQFGETVNLAVLRAHYVINLDQSRGPAAVAAHNWVGQLTPLHATSSGKILLAHQPAVEVERLLDDAGMATFTADTVTSRRVLRTQLDAARRDGYATTVEEYEAGLNAVAAPVRDHTGAVVAAISVSGPAYRLPRDRLDEGAATLIEGADRLSERLGFYPTP